MSVKIRLTRTGKTHQASYRIVAQDTHSKRDGSFLEILGFFNPGKTGAESYRLDKDRLDFWTKRGAKPTPAVSKLIEKESPGEEQADEKSATKTSHGKTS